MEQMFPEVRGLLPLGLACSSGFPHFDGHMFAVIFLSDSPNRFQMSDVSAESGPRSVPALWKRGSVRNRCCEHLDRVVARPHPEHSTTLISGGRRVIMDVVRYIRKQQRRKQDCYLASVWLCGTPNPPFLYQPFQFTMKTPFSPSESSLFLFFLFFLRGQVALCRKCCYSAKKKRPPGVTDLRRAAVCQG